MLCTSAHSALLRDCVLCCRSCSVCSRYRVLERIGEGSFCTIVTAEDTYSTDRCMVALKVMHAGSEFEQIAAQETSKLQYLNQADLFETAHIVRLHPSVQTHHTHNDGHSPSLFQFYDHDCIAMEQLHENILQYRCVTPFTVEMIQCVTRQLVHSLLFLREHGMIHGDLKPENVLLCHSVAQLQQHDSTTPLSLPIKLIDFGNAMHGVEERSLYYDTFEVQTFQYRAPEVVLGLHFDTQIDMWRYTAQPRTS